jgi:hypothetical protein
MKADRDIERDVRDELQWDPDGPFTPAGSDYQGLYRLIKAVSLSAELVAVFCCTPAMAHDWQLFRQYDKPGWIPR